jgi:RNA polymerase subunit RPABC4/transcription elongation factor Spt4
MIYMQLFMKHIWKFVLNFLAPRWRKQQRPKAEEGRGCDPSPQGFSGRPPQWDIQEAIPLSECYLFQVQGVSTILLHVFGVFGICSSFCLYGDFLMTFCSKGSKSGASMKCSGCQGSGIKVSIRHLGPSMIQQMQHACNECKGTGETINDKDRCPQCKGEKVVQEKKVLEVVVEKGMQNGQRITFPGEADEAVRLMCLFLCSKKYFFSCLWDAKWFVCWRRAKQLFFFSVLSCF